MNTDERHSRVVELLPWFANGTLPQHERALVERHVGECLPCRIALNEERRTQRLVREQPSVPLSPERGFSELISKIDSPSKGDRLAQGPVAASLLPGPRYAWAFAASAALIALIAWNALPPGAGSVDGTFSTLTSGDAGRMNVDVIFTANVDEKQRRDLIQEINGTLISGPSDIGRYTIALRAEELNGEEKITELLETLRNDERVSFAAPTFIGEAQD